MSEIHVNIFTISKESPPGYGHYFQQMSVLPTIKIDTRLLGFYSVHLKKCLEWLKLVNNTGLEMVTFCYDNLILRSLKRRLFPEQQSPETILHYDFMEKIWQ